MDIKGLAVAIGNKFSRNKQENGQVVPVQVANSLGLRVAGIGQNGEFGL